MKRLSDLKQGAYFFYGGIQWVILENDSKIGATLALAAEPAFNRAFDEENRNDWRVSSLRRELNGPFFDALIAEGANRAALPLSCERYTIRPKPTKQTAREPIALSGGLLPRLNFSVILR